MENTKEREVCIKTKGTVKWFNNKKGYGFIEYNEKDDIFIHYTEINTGGFKKLQEGSLVEFDLLVTDKGYQAKNVSVISEEATIK